MFEETFDDYGYEVTKEAMNETISAVLRRVYTLMAGGLALTGGVAWAVYSAGWVTAIAPYFLLFFAVELLLVIVLSRRIQKMNPTTATGMFLGYAALNGITMSAIFYNYTLGSIGQTFLITGGMFAAMSFLGFTTKTDMTKYRSFFIMGLVGFIIASLANFFLFPSNLLYWGLTYFGIALFLGLTAYNTQNIKNMTYGAMQSGMPKDNVLKRISTWGALALYLDFINLFILLLRIFGSRD